MILTEGQHLHRGILECVKRYLKNPAEATAGGSLQLPFATMDHKDWSRAVRLWLQYAPEGLADLPDRDCPACGSAKHRFEFFSYDGYPFHSCDACRMWFIPKKVDYALFERYWHQNPEAHALADGFTARRSDSAIDGLLTDRVALYLADLKGLFPTAKTGDLAYLDVGCGVGQSLLAAKQIGLESEGIEVDQACLAVAKARGLAVKKPGQPLDHKRFQLISFWESLEHIHDPLDVLTQNCALLDDLGLVAMTVPNLDCATVRLMRGDCIWVHGGIAGPGHINIFHIDGLKRLLDRAGLALLDWEGQYSSNFLELASYLLGHSRGARDLLENQKTPHALHEIFTHMTNAAWPVISMVEQHTALAPILRVVACRKGAERHFSEKLADFRKARQDKLRQSIDTQLVPYEDVERRRMEQLSQFHEQAAKLAVFGPALSQISESIQQVRSPIDGIAARLDAAERMAGDTKQSLVQAVAHVIDLLGALGKISDDTQQRLGRLEQIESQLAVIRPALGQDLAQAMSQVVDRLAILEKTSDEARKHLEQLERIESQFEAIQTVLGDRIAKASSQVVDRLAILEKSGDEARRRLDRLERIESQVGAIAPVLAQIASNLDNRVGLVERGIAETLPKRLEERISAIQNPLRDVHEEARKIDATVASVQLRLDRIEQLQADFARKGDEAVESIKRSMIAVRIWRVLKRLFLRN